MAEAVYGEPPSALVATAADAVQVSPLVLGGGAIESIPDDSLPRIVIAAPPGTLERRYVLAQAIRALARSGELVALAPRQKGGARLAAELTGFGCTVSENARHHHRICRCVKPAAPSGLQAAIDAGAPRYLPALDLWSQPGVFAWDRIDTGTALLLAQPWAPAGHGADLGCGVGVLARTTLTSPAVESLALIDLDRRALDAARRNIVDPRALFLHHDLRRPLEAVSDLDFAITNPPFHDGGAEDRSLGQAFVAAAAAMLKRGGVLRLVANVTLPYETVLGAHFAQVSLLDCQGGFKVLEARR